MISEILTFEQAFQLVIEGEYWEAYKKDPNPETLKEVLEDMYRFAGHSGYIEGRQAAIEEYRKIQAMQKQQMNLLEDIKNRLENTSN